MKIHGHDKLGPSQATFRMQRGETIIELLCTALPMGHFRTQLRELPRPEPALTGHPMLDARGKAMKDPDSGETLLETNEQTPEYRALLDAYRDRLAAYHIWLGLKHDPNVEFATKREGFKATMADFCDALLAELAAAGFGSNDLMALSLFILGLGGQLRAEQEQAKNV